MTQKFLIREGNSPLLLFFAGWGADDTPFRAYRPEGMDFMLCYDYRTLRFDHRLVEGYKAVHIIAWSMGVWAASHVAPTLTVPVAESLAVNGTPYPADDTRGIPTAIYRGTLEGLTGPSLHKFLRRMCADTAAFRAFLAVTPRRPLEELREELASVETACRNLPAPGFAWQQAIVAMDDRIIPPANQLQAWREAGTTVMQVEGAHYDERLFRHYLQDRWTSD